MNNIKQNKETYYSLTREGKLIVEWIREAFMKLEKDRDYDRIKELEQLIFEEELK